MADPTSSKLRGLVLSGTEIRELTGWSDAMVEDYLSILENLIILADAVDSTTTIEDDSENSLISWLLPPRKDVPATSVTTANLTASGEQKIICANTAPITITLNSIPDDMELTTIQRAKGVVTVDGNGRTINGSFTVTMNIRYMSLDFLYLVETDTWIIS